MIGYIYLRGAYLVRKDYLGLIDKYVPDMSDEKLKRLCEYLELLITNQIEKTGS